MSAQSILISRKNDVMVMRISRADKKNALSGEMYEALTAGIEEANTEKGIGVIVLLGEPGIFCAGNDINDFISFASKGTLGKPILDFLATLVDNHKPIVVGVDGPAIGIGTTLLLHCDYVIASDRSIFATPFVDLGLVPEAGSSILFPELMGHRLAFEFLVMGNKFNAESAEVFGLINKIVSHEIVEEEVMKVARAIAAKPREAVLISRNLMRPDPTILHARIEEEAQLFSQRLKSKEAHAALNNFMAAGR